MEMYRSGRNEADSKSVDGSNRPGVRIPPSPPKKETSDRMSLFLASAASPGTKKKDRRRRSLAGQTKERAILEEDDAITSPAFTSEATQACALFRRITVTRGAGVVNRGAIDTSG